MRGVVITGLPVLGLMLRVHPQFMATLQPLPHFQSLVYSIFAISVGAGLPNIWGRFAIRNTADYGWEAGAFYYEWHNEGHKACALGASTDGFMKVNFLASNSNSLYGSSGTVTPLSLSTKFFIKY